MSKRLQNFIIGIALASIFFALYGVYRGEDFTSALSGIVIGLALLGSICYENNKLHKE